MRVQFRQCGIHRYYLTKNTWRGAIEIVPASPIHSLTQITPSTAMICPIKMLSLHGGKKQHAVGSWDHKH